MVDSELPRAYANPADSPCSSSSSEEESSSTSSVDSELDESSSTSSSSSEMSRASRRRTTRKRYYRRRRDSTSTSRSRSRSRRVERGKQDRFSKSKLTSQKSKHEGCHESTNSRSTRDGHERGDTKYDRINGTDRLSSNRNTTKRNTRQSYECQCGEKYVTQKTLPSLSKLIEHFQNIHKDSLVICVYCKSVFGKAKAMSDDQWKRLKTHMYGVS
ncbi:hypothetical protein DICVIV_11909 [Dictyocaulus viviparus]|uniref:Uncharacterized protein n=1 Tax=Dictyocaulus viviparus TaxID=29172 RepID=A0A0D8XBV8_DICVI|nr:hypothetical protein DICVIV_11909 [Dictyocaulus viviparus]